MDTFEKTMESVSKKTPKEQADLIADFKSKCPCPTCPTYNNCASKAGEKLFCINGKSFMCISDDKGCSCPQCPIGKEVGLKHQKFCLKRFRDGPAVRKHPLGDIAEQVNFPFFCYSSDTSTFT